MAIIPEGASEIDSVVFRFADNNVEIKNWLTYSYNQDFLKPTSEWTFTINDSNGNLKDILVPGVGVNLYINNLIQCAGIIERVLTSITSQQGTILRVQGRDIMAKVVEGIINPKLQFPTNSTLETIIKTAIAPLGITQIDNSDHINLNVLTGKTFPPDEDQGFKKKTLKELKTHYGEGVFQFIDKLLHRQGFMMWARADGKGVVVSQPNYTNKPLYTIRHSQNQNNTTNNVLFGEKTVDITGQPTMLYCKGFSNGDDADVVSSDLIMINELIGLDENGIPLPQVVDIIAGFQDQGVKILNLRNVLISNRKNPSLINQRPINVGPCFIKDDEATSQDQLENFVKRTMANYQVKMINYNYRILGHTQNGIPWAVNTMVHVYDEALEIDEPLWIIDRTFSKSFSEGTFTDLKLIKPFTLDISTFGGKGTTSKVNYSNKK